MQKTLKDIMARHQENVERLNAIADACEAEKREMSEAEKNEATAIQRENEMLRLRAAAFSMPKETAVVNSDKFVRDNVFAQKKVTIQLTRDIQTTAALADTGILKINEAEMLKPLRTGLIWDKVGIDIRSGLVGSIRWPKHSKAVAAWADEAAKAVDSKIDFSALEVKPGRLVIAVSATREELEDSVGVVEGVIKQEMPATIIDKINEAVFTTDATAKVKGPFAQTGAQSITFAAATPTRAELLKMKSTVAANVGKFSNPAWVMSEATKALLEDLKVDAGSGRFVCENDMIFGMPVFTTSAIGSNVGFGDWSYCAAGFFGGMDIIVDPYTLARNNAVDFVLNARFACGTLYNEAFILGKPKA